MLAHFSLPTPSEPTYKEREEELRYSCDCCGEEFESGSEFSDPDTGEKWYFKYEHRKFHWHIEVLRDEAGLSGSRIMKLKERSIR